MRFILCLVVFCCAAASVVAEEVPLEDHFREYIGNWSPDVDFDAVVTRYWGPSAMMLPEGQAPVQLSSPEAISAALRAAMQPVIEAGWQGSSLVGFSSCRLRADLALVAIDYQRRYSDGRTTTDSATYVVRLAESGWKIHAVMGSDTSGVTC